MKYIAVIKVDEDATAGSFFYNRRPVGPLSGVAHPQEGQKHDRQYGALSDDCSVYWVDTEPDAEELAKKLTEWFPANTYGVAIMSTIYRRDPGPVVKSIVSEKGVLPA
jgi:hypothetical protein